MSNVSEWSTTPGSNNATPPNGWPEGMAPSAVNDSARENMAALAKWYQDTNGTLTTAGTGNAYTLTTNSAHTTLADQSLLVFKVDRANTGNVTLNVDGLGAKSMKTAGQEIPSGTLRANQTVIAFYNATNDEYEAVILGTAAVEDVATGGTGDLLRADGTLVWAASEITIASGVATPGAGPSFTVDTEADAASDDLDLFDVTSWSDGAIKQFRAESAARTVVLKHDTGTVTATNKRIFLSGDADLSLDDTDKSILLQRRGAEVHEVTRSAAMSPLSESFTSTEQTITAGGLLTLAHGLSSMPLIVVVEAVCQTAENNYAIGDVIVLAPGLSGASDVSTRGFALKKDATNIYIRTHPTTGVNYLDDSTGANVALTAANWKYRVRAWV